MQIIVKKYSRYPSVHIIEGGTTLDLGLLDERERDEMAKEFVEALWAMGPVGSDDCAAWLARMLAEVGIDMPNTTGQGRSDCGAYPGPGCSVSESKGNA